MIPYGKQDINQADIDSVIEVLQSDYLTQGPKVPLFEKKLSNSVGAQFSVAVNSATSALHIACLALELGEGDVLWTSPNTFVASANCAVYCGANVDFVDIDPYTYNMSTVELEKKLVEARKNNCLPKVVIPVHFAGQSCEMKRIHELGGEYGFKIIEDASHAIGGSYLNERVGRCQFSDITVFSFHPVKIITTAEGGAATTNSHELASKMRLLRSHGVTREQELMDSEPGGAWHYQQTILGFNYRMTELQAALGISQMDRLDEFVENRHALAKRYNELLRDLPLVIPKQSIDSYSAFHLYPVQIDFEKVSIDKSLLFDKLRSHGIGVNVHYIPVHTQPFYRERGFSFGDFPQAESYYNHTISIPLFHKMTFGEQDRVIDVLKEILIGELK